MNQRVERALLFATRRHRGQFREGNLQLPYITHPIEVMLKLAHVGQVRDEELLCAALLHDLVEETMTTHEELRKKFGRRVADLVQELTRHDPEGSWIERAERQLLDATKMSPDAQIIKLADRLSNTEEALRFRTGNKLTRYLWQSDRLHKVVPRDVNPYLWDELQTVLALYHHGNRSSL